MKKFKIEIKSLLFITLLAGILFVPVFVFAEKDVTPEKDEKQDQIKDLNDKIEEKNDVLNDIQLKIKQYEINIKQKQEEALTLESQLDLLEEDMDKNKAKVEKVKTELEKIEYEIGENQLQILQKGEEIDIKKVQLSGFLNKIYKNEQKTFLEILLVNDTLSDFTSQVSYEEEIQKEFQKILDDVQDQKEELNKVKGELEINKENKKEKKSEFIAQRNALEGEQEYANNLLVNIEGDEEKFAELVSKMRSEREDIEAEIYNIEDKLKKKVEEPKKDGGDTEEEISPYLDLDEFDPIWPVAGPITATFHDPTYPFKRWFEHDAIDIAAPQGTQIKAADSGYVAVARWDGSSSYSYILIVHADSYATLYGHTSAVYVEPEDFVKKGEIIGLTGGMPGTPGAGSYTTGSHIHFGVRYNGIPVDPLGYLP
ncbi:MAG: peptidoglycan DD-metalloendopeptidase family protein [Patescibacteria group bacterium]